MDDLDEVGGEGSALLQVAAWQVALWEARPSGTPQLCSGIPRKWLWDDLILQLGYTWPQVTLLPSEAPVCSVELAQQLQ